jgi:hypothetical protein
MLWVLSGTHDGGLARLDLAQQRQALASAPTLTQKSLAKSKTCAFL